MAEIMRFSAAISQPHQFTSKQTNTNVENGKHDNTNYTLRPGETMAVAPRPFTNIVRGSQQPRSLLQNPAAPSSLFVRNYCFHWLRAAVAASSARLGSAQPLLCCVGIIFQTAAYGESLFLFWGCKPWLSNRSAHVFTGCVIVRSRARTCPTRCPADCSASARAGRCLCCGRSSCRSSSSRPPTRPTGPGYLQEGENKGAPRHSQPHPRCALTTYSGFHVVQKAHQQIQTIHIIFPPPHKNWFKPTLKQMYCSSALISTQGTYKSDAVTFQIMIVNYKIDLDIHPCTTFNLFFSPLAQHICIHKKAILGEFSATSLDTVLQCIVMYYRHLHTTGITAKFTIFFSSWFSILINDKNNSCSITEQLKYLTIL